MSILIEELKHEHSDILATLNEVKKLGILSKEGQTKLLAAKAVLLEHLQNEDDRLYPILKANAEQNKALENTLDLFAMDMKNVSNIVKKFFKKFSIGVVYDEIQKDFELLFSALVERIKNEEDLLYDELERLQQ
ncbi:MAG: hemerythrin domain-containing protein [Candidatus Scalindua sp.]|nr:hemerythrin domain-containing protein [Candidatus Scalindua sp.]